MKVSVVGGNWLEVRYPSATASALAALLAFWSARGSALGSFRLLSCSTLLGLILRLALLGLLRLLGCGFGKGLERVCAPPFVIRLAATGMARRRWLDLLRSRLRAARSCHMCDIEQRRSAGAGPDATNHYHKP